jgi:hypothetical protein
MMQQSRWVLGFVVAGAWLAAAAPAGAQTLPASTFGPPGTSWFIGGTAGAGVVQNVGGAFGGEIGTTVSPKLALFAEGLDVTDTATRRRIGTAQNVAAELQTTQGTPASATLRAPAGIFLGGLRYVVHQSGNLRIFVQGEGGVARVTFQPTFLLGGVDVTSQLAQFGVTLGADLAGTTTKPAFGGGFGVSLRHGMWDLGAVIGVTSIKTPSQSSNVIRATATVAHWF